MVSIKKHEQLMAFVLLDSYLGNISEFGMVGDRTDRAFFGFQSPIGKIGPCADRL